MSKSVHHLIEGRANWLVTGAAGFIGSNLVEHLLRLGQEVVGVDNFATGHQRNLDDVRVSVGNAAWSRFRFIDGDIRDIDTCRDACRGIDYILHQAALGSVPRSIADPLQTNSANVTGFLNILHSAREANVRRFVYAASSSTYGDHPALPKVEDRIGRPLSPYAVSKYVNELYASVFHRTYGIETVGLRYFNVFGRRQDPDGAYAAVIPRWIGRLLQSETCEINGDGNSSRDFCYIDNVLQANVLAAISSSDGVCGEVFNVACGERTTLVQLYEMIASGLRRLIPNYQIRSVGFTEFRAGDVRHSHADITKARERLGYEPTHSVEEGLFETLRWYVDQSGEATVSLLSA